MKISLIVSCAATACATIVSLPGAEANFWDFFGNKKDAWSFSPLSFPVNNADFTRVRSTAVVANGKGEKDVLRANTIIRGGQQPKPNGGIFGAGLNFKGEPIYTNSSAKLIQVGDAPDFTSLHAGPAENQYWAISHIESPAPGQVYKTLVEQNPLTGSLTALETAPIDFSKVNGVWTPCAGSVTPWLSHLGSEEYEPDARLFAKSNDTNLDKDVVAFNKYFQLYENNATKANIEAVFNPYDYGHAWEVSIARDGATRVAKRLAMGRLAFELYRCLDDKKTCYAGDDGDNTMFAKFVADKAGDLSSGSLYEAKLTQNEGKDKKPEWSVRWIKLGSACDADIQSLLDSKIKFADIFETAKWENDSCPAGFLSVNAGYAGAECLKVKPGMEKAAAFLETRRYAGMLRVTTEFNKMEGVAYNQEEGKVYLSITSVRRGMEDNGDKGKTSKKYDTATDNDIKLPYNPCGCVFEFDLDQTRSATSARLLICGQPATYQTGTAESQEHGAFSNTCNVNGIANPDNLHYVNKAGVLFIYEDSDFHSSNTMWALTTKTGKLTRVGTAVQDAEFSSANYQKVGDFGYLIYTIQHPYDSLSPEEKAALPDAAPYVNYLGPFKNTAVDY